MYCPSLKSFFYSFIRLGRYSTRALDMLRRFRVCGFVTLAMCVLEANADIYDTLTYWETLTVSSLHRRTVKRGTTSTQTVEFDSFGRHFALILHRNLSILAPGFKAFVFDADGSSRQIRPDFDLYRGTVDGDSGSFISAYFNADQALSASIRTSTETYSIEPAGNLVPDSPSDAMIIYRESDLKWNNRSRCGYVEEDKNSTIVKETTSEKHYAHRNRSKRKSCKSSFGKTCLLYIAADPHFVRGKGRHSIKETSSYMLKVIDYVDGIFREANFPECGKGFGFRVMKMNIFNSSTKGYQYTDLERKFDYLKFLQVFGEDDENDNACHGHIFTQQSFTHEGYSVLGLAYLANPDMNKVGGVCSRSKSRGMAFSKNVGWTTFLLGKTIVSDLQGTLVTAHEFGHSWGSSHDPDTNEECSPKSSNLGKYLMYPISVSGRDKNNNYFSPCSLIAIDSVLHEKANCFVTKKQAFCGNFLVEDDEECDAGISYASDDGSKCCDRNCKLKPKAVCSNANHACCTEDCQIISDTSYPCYLPREDDCFETTFCDGTHRTCPAFKTKPSGSPCSLKGQCQNGVCIPFCKLHNYDPCMCDDMSNGCKWCCIYKNGTCAPLVIRDNFTLLPAGTFCVGGICDDNGICLESMSGIVARLWELLDLSSPGAFVRFMQNNFVSTIIILTLFLWFPASCYICYLDRRAKDERLKILREVVEEVSGGKIPGLTAPMTVPDSHDKKMLRENIRRLTIEVNNSLPSDSPPYNSKEQTSAESQTASKHEHEPKHEAKDEPEQEHKREQTPKQEDELRRAAKAAKHSKRKLRRSRSRSLEHTDEHMPEHRDEPTTGHKHGRKRKSKQILQDAGMNSEENDFFRDQPAF